MRSLPSFTGFFSLALCLGLAQPLYAQEPEQVPMPDGMPPPEEPPGQAVPVPVPMPVPVPVPVPDEDAPPADMTPEDEREARRRELDEEREQREEEEADRTERDYRDRRSSDRETVLDESKRQQEENFGAVLAPLALPRGASSVYGWIGLPDFAAGYRHGLGKVELEARATLNYYWMSLALEGRLRVPVYKKDRWELAVPIGLGLVFSPGATWVDDDAVDYVGLRGSLGAMAIYKLTETVHPIFEFEASNDFVFTSGGVHNASIVVGGGAEVYLARGWSALFSARLGWNGVQDQLEPLKAQAAVQIRLGLGYRLF
jgi:hypothetical protein